MCCSHGQVEKGEVSKTKYRNRITKWEGKLPMNVVCLVYWFMTVHWSLLGKSDCPPALQELYPVILDCRECCYLVSTPKTYVCVSEYANHLGSMLLMFLLQWYRCKCCHRSSLTRLHWVHHAKWLFIELTGVWGPSTWLSHHLETVNLWLQGTVMNRKGTAHCQAAFFSSRYHIIFRFCITVSSNFHLPL